MDANVAKLLEERREPGIWLGILANPKSNSRLGGLPALPRGIEWPVHLDTGAPLHFVAQIDLSELPATPLPGCRHRAALPREGMLFFFADFDDDMSDFVWEDPEEMQRVARVIFAKAAGADRAAPDDLPMFKHALGELDGEFALDTNIFEVAHVRAAAIDTFWADDDRGFSVFPKDEDAEAKRQSIEKATGAAVTHGVQMLGAEECWIYGDNNPRAEILLLQADAGHFGDTLDDGIMQFWIRPEHLRKGRFDLAYATVYFN